MGVMGTIYRSHADTPFSKLGLDYCKAKKLIKDLNALYIQYATDDQNQEEARLQPTQCKWDRRGFI